MKKALVSILGLLAGVFVACTPSPAKGFLQIDISGLPTGVNASVTVSGVTDPVTASTTLQLDPGSYTVSASPVTSGTSTYNATVTGSPATLTENNTSVVTVTYALQNAAGAVNPAKTFTAPFGIGSLAFLNSAGTGQGRLYASSNAATGADIGGRLFLEPTDLSGADKAVPSGQIVQGTATDTNSLAEILFSSAGVFYQLRRDAGTTFQTLISRYPRTTAVANNFAAEQFVITNGYFTPSATTTDRALTLPTDMALDTAGNLWVVDPTGTARAWRGDVTGSPAGRLVCYSKADQDTAAGGATAGQIGTPGVIYFDGPVAGAKTIAIDSSNNIWIGSGTGTGAKLYRISGLTCPNLNATTQDPVVTDLAPLPTGVTVPASLSGTALVGPVDLAISGTNLLIAQSNGTTNNILSIPTTTTTFPTTITPTTINGLTGSITSIAVDSSNKTWVGTSATGSGKIYRLP